MKKLKRAFGSVKNLSKTIRTVDHENSSSLPKSLPGSSVNVSDTSSSNSGLQEPSYVSYDNQSLDSYHESFLQPNLESKFHPFSKLHKAAFSGDPAKIKKALKKVNVNSLDANGRTALHVAAAAGQTDSILVLLGSLPNLEIEDKDGKTPFLTAVEKNHIRVAHLLLQSKILADVTDNYDNSALHIASKSGSKDLLELLLDRQLNVNAVNVLGQTPLHIASSELNIDAVKCLHQYGADVNAKDKECVTPLMLAAKFGCNSLVEYLLSIGANPALTDRTQWNAASYAKYNMYFELSDKLEALVDETKENKTYLFGFKDNIEENKEVESGNFDEKSQVEQDTEVNTDDSGSLDSWNDDTESFNDPRNILATTFLAATNMASLEETNTECDNSKTLSNSSSSLGPPKPPRLFASTPNLAKNLRLSVANTGSTPNLSNICAHEDRKEEKCDRRKSGYDDNSNQDKSISNKSFKTSVGEGSTASDINFDDTNPVDLLAHDWVNDSLRTPQQDINEKSELPNECSVSTNASNHSDDSEEEGYNSNETVLESHEKDVDFVDKSGIIGTFGRQGTLQEIEEIWESNARIDNSAISEDSRVPDNSYFNASDFNNTTPEDASGTNLSLKRFFGDSTDNVFQNPTSDEPDGSEHIPENETSYCELVSMIHSGGLLSLNGQSTANAISSSSSSEDVSTDGGEDGVTLSTSRPEHLITLVRELRLSLSKETVKRKSSNQKLSYMKKIETDLRDQLKEAESSTHHFKNEATLLGNKLAQMEYKMYGWADDAEFAQSSLNEACKHIDTLEAERKEILNDIVDKNISLENLKEENVTERKIKSCLEVKLQKLSVGHNENMCVEDSKPNFTNQEVQTLDIECAFPHLIKGNLSETLNEVECILCDASTQIEKIIEDESISIEDNKELAEQSSQTDITVHVHDNARGDVLFRSLCDKNAYALPERFSMAVQTDNENSDTLSSPMEYSNIATLLKSIVKDSNEDMKNIFNCSVKEVLLKEREEERHLKSALDTGTPTVVNDSKGYLNALQESICNEVSKIIQTEEASSKLDLDSKLECLREILSVTTLLNENLSKDSFTLNQCLVLSNANSVIMDKLQADINALPEQVCDIYNSYWNPIQMKFENNQILLDKICKNLSSLNDEYKLNGQRDNDELCAEISNLKACLNDGNRSIKDFFNEMKCSLEGSQVCLNQSINRTVKELLTNMDETVAENFQIVQNFLQHLHQSLVERLNEIRLDKVKEADEVSKQLKMIGSGLEDLKKILNTTKHSVDVCQEFHSKPNVDDGLIKALQGSVSQNFSTSLSQNQALLSCISKLERQINSILEQQNLFHNLLSNVVTSNVTNSSSEGPPNDKWMLNEFSCLRKQNEDVLQSVSILKTSLKDNLESEWESRLSSSEKDKQILAEENQRIKTAYQLLKEESCMKQIKNENPNIPSNWKVMKLDKFKDSIEDKDDILPVANDVKDGMVPSSNLIEAPYNANQKKELQSLKTSLNDAKLEINILVNEKRSVEKEFKESKKIVNGLKSQILELESDQSELENELSMKTSHIILLKKEAANHLKKIKESKEQIADYVLARSRNVKLEQKCRELDLELSSKQTLIESLQERINIISKEKLNLLHELSHSKSNHFASQILMKEKEVAEESARNLEKELKDIYEKLSFEYIPKNKLESLYSQIESHFQVTMSGKFKELNELLEEKFRTRNGIQPVPQEQNLCDTIVQLQNEMKTLKSKLEASYEKSEIWQKQYNALRDRYQQLFMAIPVESQFTDTILINNKPNIEDDIQDIEAYIKRPYPRSKFLEEVCSSISSSSRVYNEQMNRSSFVSDELESSSHLKAEKDSGFDVSQNVSREKSIGSAMNPFDNYSYDN